MNSTEVRVLEECSRRGHEQVVFFHYPEVGLKAIVSIHSTVLGPALGGCRMRLYENESEAIDDVMRLAEGMTYKSALAGMELGGGKACIIADPALSEGRKELFVRFGHCLNNLNGRYYSAEDMGTSVQDMVWVRQVTKFVTGGSPEQGGSGDPSPWTALGAFEAIKATCEFRYGTADLSNRTVSVQGVGHVGGYLVELLTKAGATLIVTDTNEQTLDDSVYDALESKQILYVPDFAMNSGGVVSVGAELRPGGWDDEWVTAKVETVGETTMNILQQSKERGRFPEVVALELAREKIQAARP